MSSPDPSLDEAGRLAVLRRYHVLDTPREQALDNLTALAAEICHVPISAITLVDEHRQWFKARVGLEATETRRSESFCAFALRQTDLLIVSDVAEDKRFASNPLVVGELGIRFYAGAPLVTPEGAVLGTLCVIDRVPRTLTLEQQQALRVLGGQVMTHFELRRQTRELAESEQLLRAIFDAEPECVKLLSANGRVQMMNGAGLRLIEAGSFEQVSGESLYPLVAEEYREKVMALTERVFHGESATLEFPLMGLKGTPRQVEIHAAPLRDQTGAVTALLGITRDVTGRKEAESHLRLLETCVSRLNDMIFITEAEPLQEPGPRILFVNEAFTRITGYTKEEALGRSPRFLQGSKTSRTELDRIHSALRERKPVRAELINYTKSGAEIWLELDIVPVMDAAGRCTHLVAVERDITERKRSEARFRWLVDSNAQGVMFWKISGEITGANNAFLHTVGYSREDLEAGRINWTAMTPPEDDDLDRRFLAEISSTGVCAPFEKEFIRKDGLRVPLLIGAAAFEDNPEEGVSFVLDLTERKKLEHQFLRAQRMESIGTLAGGIAHDLNNVLSPIMTAIELLQMHFPDPASQELLAILSASARRGADMVRQVLSFARGVEGRRIEVQVRHLVHEIEQIVRDTFHKHIEMRTIVPNQLRTIMGDPTQLHQVLLNLCVNARDAMPDGGTLVLAAENLEVDAHYVGLHPEAHEGSYVVLKVEDTGSGMPPETLDRIYDPFFTTKEVGKGTGLGLSTTLAIVKSHGGFIRVESKLGKGTTFRIYLPAPTETLPTAEARPAAETPRGNGQLILVVDDEAGVREITQRTLVAFGYQVILASDGTEAVAAFGLRAAEVKLVITDMMMPVMDGPTTIRILRKMNPNLLIIASSGLPNDLSAAGLGMQRFLPKPYTGEALLSLVAEILSRDRA